MREHQVLVYVDLAGESVLAGRLYVRARTNTQTSSFIYDTDWLEHRDAFAIDPELPLGPGDAHSGAKALFGALSDTAPDRWGRWLMQRGERQRAAEAGETPRTLLEADYLLRVNDEARQGALRFALPITPAQFEAPTTAARIPPLVALPRLLSAAELVADDAESADDLRQLMAPGSSLGGARPKASVRDNDGSLAIAKFPDRDDRHDTVRWEAVALHLAARAGIDVPTWRLETVGDHDVLLMTRFDRTGSIRHPYMSAMTLLCAQDHQAHSYLEIADGLRTVGAQPRADTRALWRRMVFNIMISNTDDHLRNHGFVHVGTAGWRLAPAFDMNPTPVEIKARIHSTAIGIDERDASLETALAYADYFEIEPDQARRIAADVGAAVSTWASTATALGLSQRDIQRMASAFEHADSQHAQILARDNPNDSLGF